MIENILRSIGGVGVFGLFSVCLFFGFFTAMLFWAVRLKKPYLNSMQALPLDDGREPNQPRTEGKL